MDDSIESTQTLLVTNRGMNPLEEKAGKRFSNFGLRVRASASFDDDSRSAKVSWLAP